MPNNVSKTAMMRYIAMRMAERGPAIVRELTDLVGGHYGSGHAVDYMMTSMAKAEEAMLQSPPNVEVFLDSITKALFLARDIAIREGKIVVSKPASEKPS